MTQYLLSVHMIEGADAAAAGGHGEDVPRRRSWSTTRSRRPARGSSPAGCIRPDTATTVRVSDGEVLFTDGPFAETKEQIGGFWVIEAADLDAALAWASKATVACQAPVEVRPFQDAP